MRKLIRHFVLACTMLAGCSSADQVRDTDRSAFMPSARARWAWREARQPVRADRVAYRPTLEASVSHIEGDLAQSSGRADYQASTAHIAFAPELAWHQVRVSPLVGAGYGEIEVTSGNGRAAAEGLGLALGIEASWQGWSWVEPYVRYAGGMGGEWEVRRFEAGVDLRASAVVGVQLAYARQINEIEDFELFGVIQDARVETEGLHVGLSLRF